MVCEAGPALSLLGHSKRMQTALPAKWVITGPARGPELTVGTIPDIEWRTLKRCYEKGFTVSCTIIATIVIIAPKKISCVLSVLLSSFHTWSQPVRPALDPLEDWLKHPQLGRFGSDPPRH